MNDMQKLLSKLPQVDEVLNDPRLFVFFEEVSRPVIVDAIREAIDIERQKILKAARGARGDEEISFDDERFYAALAGRIRAKNSYSLRRAVNATGVVLHTNLGRAVLPASACANMQRAAAGYSTLEYDVKKGSRGHRHSHVEGLITKITGAEAAMIVNNNAAATMLCLSAMAAGREVIVSRGELVEIGGSFRIPDIMKQSGAVLREVGATNKTSLRDYEAAISDETAAIMKVHTSNYRIIGFTAEAELGELAALGRSRKLPVIYDMGSGLLVSLKAYGIDEPTVGEKLKAGIDVILFSGDKLLGGPQAGIIAGRREWIDRMKAHPLARAMRVDKMTLAAMEETLRIYLDRERALAEIPVLRMLTQDEETMRARAGKLIELMASGPHSGEIASIDGQVGGGSAPTALLRDIAVRIDDGLPAEKLERRLRRRETPVIARIIRDRVYLDMRTVSDGELEIIAGALAEAGAPVGDTSI